MVSYMISIGLEVHDIDMFFQAVGGKYTSEIDLDTFVEGCMTMRGSATCLDVNKIMCITRALFQRVQEMEKDISQSKALMLRVDKKFDRGVREMLEQRSDLSPERSMSMGLSL